MTGVLKRNYTSEMNAEKMLGEDAEKVAICWPRKHISGETKAAVNWFRI